MRAITAWLASREGCALSFASPESLGYDPRVTEFVRARNSTEAFWAFDPFAVVKPDDPRFADIEKDLPREHFGVSAPVRRYFSDPARKPGSVKFVVGSTPGRA